MAAAQKFINDGLTTLNGAIDDVTTSIVVADASVFPAISGDEWFKVTLAPATTETTYEVVKVTAVAANTLTVVRGVEGTAQSWASGSKAENRLTAADIAAMLPNGLTLNTVLYLSTGSQDDWSPTGLDGAAYLRVTGTADPTIITGIDSSFAVDGTLLVIENLHPTQGLVLAHNSGSSTALNNFDFRAAEDYYLTKNERVMLIRGGSKWRDFSPKYLTLTDLGTAALEDVGAFDAAGAAAAAQAASQPLNTLLTAIAALATTGIMVVTGAGTTALRTITGTANQVNVSNGDGVAGNPTLSLPQDIHTGASPTFAAVTATTFTGALSGNATTATTATNAVNSGITDDTSTNATMYPVWVTAATGNLPLKVSSTDITWNPSTNTLALTGGPYTNTQAVAATSTDGLVLATSATATSGNQKWSPRVRFSGSYFSGSAKTTDWIIENQPSSGGGQFTVSHSDNGAAYAINLQMIAGGICQANRFSLLSGAGGQIDSTGVSVGSDKTIGFSNTANANSGKDTFLSRGAAANLQMGALAAANPPVAQTLSVQDASGTDIAPAKFTLRCSRGTGDAVNTGVLYEIQTPDVGVSGTTLQTATAKVTLTGDGILAITKGVSALNRPRVQSVASSATVTPNADTEDLVKITAQAVGLTIANPTNASSFRCEGQKLMIRIKDNAGAQTIAFGSEYRAMGTALPTTTVAGKTLYLGFIFNETDTKWDLVSSAQEA